jgi:SAM-dependent methyltransferase
MSYLKRIQTIVRSHGPRAAVAKFVGIAADRWFDWRHGTDNCTPLALDHYTIVGDSRKNATSYGASRVMPLKRLFPLLRQRAFGGGVFVDFGCGNGKVLLVAKHCGIQPVRGVEFARELCELARRNWQAYCRQTGTPLAAGEFLVGDVSVYECRPDETMYFIYNPFDELILRKVLANISASLRAHPRALAIIICNPNPFYQAVMREQQEFPHLQQAKFWGYPYFIYSNQPG